MGTCSSYSDNSSSELHTSLAAVSSSLSNRNETAIAGRNTSLGCTCTRLRFRLKQANRKARAFNIKRKHYYFSFLVEPRAFVTWRCQYRAAISGWQTVAVDAWSRTDATRNSAMGLLRFDGRAFNLIVRLVINKKSGTILLSFCLPILWERSASSELLRWASSRSR